MFTLVSDCISYRILYTPTLWATNRVQPLASWSLKRDHKSFTLTCLRCISEKMAKKEKQCIYSTKFPNNCLISSSTLGAHQKGQTHCLSKIINNKFLSYGVICMWKAPCWSPKCFSNTSLLLSISVRSCPNDDPRHTFNHYLHCPFKNYSTPLHNFNHRNRRRILVINSLIDAIF